MPKPIAIAEPPAAAAAGGRETIPFLSYGFRVFFLAASAWTAIAMVLWIGMLASGTALPSVFSGPVWHAHEMLFGFIAAAVAGFLLTAVPAWTQAPVPKGWPLAALGALWLAGRVLVSFGAGVPPTVVAAVDVGFLALIAIWVARMVVSAGNRRNSMIIAAIAILAVANALSYWAVIGLDPDVAAAGERLGLQTILLLITIIGGRIIPAFTTGWLDRKGFGAGRPAAFNRFDAGVLAIVAIAAIADVASPGTMVAGALLVLAGLMHAARLGRWRGHRTVSEPLIWVLHVAYLWLAFGTILLGLSGLWDDMPRTTGVHTLTVGAMGMMLVGVMSRASLGHTGRPLVADGNTTLIYVLVLIAALARLAASMLPGAWMALLMVAAAAWVAAFSLFVVAYWPVWTEPRADPRAG